MSVLRKDDPIRQSLADWADEQELIACDLHDGLVQWLVGAALQLDSITLEDEIPAAATRGKIEEARSCLRQAMRQARELIGNLAAARIEPGELLAELEKWVAQCQAENLRIQRRWDKRLAEVSPLLAGSIFSIFRESLWNVIRHAKATNVFLAAKWLGHAWSLVVLDNGQGISLESLESDRRGLRGIAARAAVFGGQAAWRSSRMASDAFAAGVDRWSAEFPSGLSSDLFSTGTLMTIQLPHRA